MTVFKILSVLMLRSCNYRVVLLKVFHAKRFPLTQACLCRVRKVASRGILDMDISRDLGMRLCHVLFAASAEWLLIVINVVCVMM